MDWSPIARAQGGVVSRQQLLSAGVSPAKIGRMLGDGALVRVAAGVYAARGVPDTYRARLWTAVLRTDGVLGFGTAAELWGLVRDRPPAIQVIVPPERRIVAPNGTVVHRISVPRHEIRERSGLPVTDRSWTALDQLGVLTKREASIFADRALQQRWITVRDLDARLHDFSHRRGNPALRRLRAALTDGAAAASERRLHRLLRRAGVTGWIPNYPLWVEGELVAVIDVALVEQRIAIEVDGMAFHVDADRFRRDRSRQNALVGLGWTVLRFTWADLTERPGYVLTTVRRLAA